MRRTLSVVASVGVALMPFVGASHASQSVGLSQFTLWGEGQSTCETWLAGRKSAVGTPEHTRTAQMRHWRRICHTAIAARRQRMCLQQFWILSYSSGTVPVAGTFASPGERA